MSIRKYRSALWGGVDKWRAKNNGVVSQRAKSSGTRSTFYGAGDFYMWSSILVITREEAWINRLALVAASNRASNLIVPNYVGNFRSCMAGHSWLISAAVMSDYLSKFQGTRRKWKSNIYFLDGLVFQMTCQNTYGNVCMNLGSVMQNWEAHFYSETCLKEKEKKGT